MRTFGLCCKKNVRGGGMGRSRLLFDRFERQTKASIMRGLRLHALLPVALDDGDPAIAEKGDIPAEEAAAGKMVHLARGAAHDGQRRLPVGQWKAV